MLARGEGNERGKMNPVARWSAGIIAAFGIITGEPARVLLRFTDKKESASKGRRKIGRKYRRLYLPGYHGNGRTLLIRCDRDLDPSRSPVIRENGARANDLSCSCCTRRPAGRTGGREKMREPKDSIIFIAVGNIEIRLRGFVCVLYSRRRPEEKYRKKKKKERKTESSRRLARDS